MTRRAGKKQESNRLNFGEFFVIKQTESYKKLIGIFIFVLGKIELFEHCVKVKCVDVYVQHCMKVKCVKVYVEDCTRQTLFESKVRQNMSNAVWK